jgi:hypothetical protein
MITDPNLLRFRACSAAVEARRIIGGSVKPLEESTKGVDFMGPSPGDGKWMRNGTIILYIWYI